MISRAKFQRRKHYILKRQCFEVPNYCDISLSTFAIDSCQDEAFWARNHHHCARLCIAASRKCFLVKSLIVSRSRLEIEPPSAVIEFSIAASVELSNHDDGIMHMIGIKYRHNLSPGTPNVMTRRLKHMCFSQMILNYLMESAPRTFSSPTIRHLRQLIL